MKKEIKIDEIEVNSPFKVNDDFFLSLENKILVQISDEELPSFGQIRDPFIVPISYFNQLESEILVKIDSNKKENLFKIVRRNSKIWFGAAASIVFLVGFFIYQQNVAYPTIDDLSDDEIVAYLEYQSDDYTEIAANLNVNDALATEMWSESMNVTDEALLNELNPESLKEYINSDI